MNSQEWNIKPRKPACDVCHAAFADRQPYMSRLTFTDQGYERFDFCMPCWTQSDQQRPEAVSIWKGVFETPAPRPEDPLKKENVETLLRGLMEVPDPAKAGVRYLLAIILERKRILIEKSVAAGKNGEATRVYEHRKTGESFIIEDPGLDFDKLEQVELEVKNMLSGRDPAPADTAQSAAEPSQPAMAPAQESETTPANAGP